MKKVNSKTAIGETMQDLREKYDAMEPEQKELYNRQVQKLAMNRLSQKGIRFSMPLAHPSLWQKIRLAWSSYHIYKAQKYPYCFSAPLKSFIVKQSTMVTLSAATPIFLEMDIDEIIRINEDIGSSDNLKKGLEFINKEKDRIIKIISICIHNSGDTNTSSLEKFFNKNMTAEQAKDVFTKVVIQMGIDHFLSLTALVPAINLATYAEIKNKGAQSAKKTGKSQ